MEVKLFCPTCGKMIPVDVDLDSQAVRYELYKAGWKKRSMNISLEERERRKLQGESLRGGGRPKGLKNSHERIDKGVKRGSMKRGSEL